MRWYTGTLFNEATHVRLDVLNTRITELDEKFEREKAEILRYVDERGAELTRMLNQFKRTAKILQTSHSIAPILFFKQMFLIFLHLEMLLKGLCWPTRLQMREL